LLQHHTGLGIGAAIAFGLGAAAVGAIAGAMFSFVVLYVVVLPATIGWIAIEGLVKNWKPALVIVGVGLAIWLLWDVGK
jgi:hypothetical protein